MNVSDQCSVTGLQQICDSYSLENREYFFDRSPRNFDAILGLYRNGKLHLPAGVCVQVSCLWEEIFLFLYWDILLNLFWFRISVRSWSTGAWMTCTWSPAASTPTTAPAGSCPATAFRWGDKLSTFHVFLSSQCVFMLILHNSLCVKAVAVLISCCQS